MWILICSLQQKSFEPIKIGLVEISAEAINGARDLAIMSATNPSNSLDIVTWLDISARQSIGENHAYIPSDFISGEENQCSE